MNLFKPYIEALAGSDQQNAEELAVSRAAQTKSQIELEIATLDVKIQTLTTDVRTLSRQFPLPLVAVTTKMDNLAFAARTKAQYSEILAGLFPAS